VTDDDLLEDLVSGGPRAHADPREIPQLEKLEKEGFVRRIPAPHHPDDPAAVLWQATAKAHSM
jgi:hypothetical protein